jgi:hypothetical protein
MFKDSTAIERQWVNGKEREKLKMTPTFELEKMEASDGVMQVNFHQEGI